MCRQKVAHCAITGFLVMKQISIVNSSAIKKGMSKANVRILSRGGVNIVYAMHLLVVQMLGKNVKSFID